MSQADADRRFMMRALEMATRGQGSVEPNPMVGCVLVQDDDVVGEGWHQHFGGPHAEVEAIRNAGDAAQGATMYVTLEPCCHQGKTPPCTKAILDASVSRVVTAMRDPFPQVDGGGLNQLQAAGVQVEIGLLAEEARRLNRPYCKLVETGRPWVIAKWAMTLDGKLAARSGDSQWISNESSRAVVHDLRGRVDAILVGRGTVAADDPQLTARPPGARTAVRIVLDSQASLAPTSQLVETVSQAPVLVAAAQDAPAQNIDRLRQAGCEVLTLEGDSQQQRMASLLDELGRRRMTNLLVEGGSQVLGALFDAQAVDEAHIFIAPKIIGGNDAPSPVAGAGLDLMSQAYLLELEVVEQFDGDLYLRGLVRPNES